MPAIPKTENGNGYLDATTDANTIATWLERWPHANIGVATRANGLLVLDVDPHHGGDDTLVALEYLYGSLPLTPAVISGREGRHVYFKAPFPDTIHRRATALGEGLDLPNYVVAPPSIHPDNGRAYAWDVFRHPGNTPLADTPYWLLAMAKHDLNARPSQSITPRGWLRLVFDAIIDDIEAHGGQLRPDGNGGMTGRCPMHDDNSPSLSIHPERGWICFAGCGNGRLTLLAARLGVRVKRGGTR